MSADQQVAHCATHQVAGESRIAQSVQHAQRVGTDVLARDVVLVARNDAQGNGRNGLRGNGGRSVSKVRRGPMEASALARLAFAGGVDRRIY
jgi:hypothetical protein